MATVKKRSHLARSPSEENRLPLFAGSNINYCSNATEVAQWATPRCSRPQPAMDNGVRDCTSN